MSLSLSVRHPRVKCPNYGAAERGSHSPSLCRQHSSSVLVVFFNEGNAQPGLSGVCLMLVVHILQTVPWYEPPASSIALNIIFFFAALFFYCMYCTGPGSQKDYWIIICHRCCFFKSTAEGKRWQMWVWCNFFGLENMKRKRMFNKVNLDAGKVPKRLEISYNNVGMCLY